MANKNTDPIEMLADSICNSLVSASARAGKETAPFDKSYPTQIVGVNTDFISTIDAETRQSLILKFGLTDDPAENKYIVYINGEYYCCTSQSNYGLYENVVVFAPNGDWDRLYIAKTNISEADLSDAEDYIEGFYNPDDHRFYYSYAAGTGGDPGTFSDEIFGASGILYFDLLRRRLYNYDATAEIFRLISTEGHGVGEWMDEGHTSERFNDYDDNISEFKYDHIEGKNNQSRSTYGLFTQEGYNHISGCNNYLINGYACTVGGNGNSNTEYTYCVVIYGVANRIRDGQCSFISGSNNTISDVFYQSLLIGLNNNCYGMYRSIVYGWNHVISSIIHQTLCGGQSIVFNGDAYDSIITGNHNIISYAAQSVVCGEYNEGDFLRSMICGNHNDGWVEDSVVCGSYADISNGNSFLIIAGGGSSTSNKVNVFTVSRNGDVTARRYLTSGADYGEYFEWAYGNPNGDDRRGMIVMLKGDKIVPAQGDDFIGVISNNASVVGNCAEDYWHGKYVKDEFGTILRDENNQPIISDKYDSTKQYIPRSARSEWTIVGLVGRLIVFDDNSCNVGDYITTVDGIAVKSKQKTSARVLRRTGNNHIEILIK